MDVLLLKDKRGSSGIEQLLAGGLAGNRKGEGVLLDLEDEI
jgi:hypothetical protein